MAELGFIRAQHGLMPDGQEAEEWFAKVKPGARVVANVSVPRNPKFHKRFFAMLNAAYANWDGPQVVTPNGLLRCSYETFREEVTIQAGYYFLDLNTRGELVPKAKSIKWLKMDEVEFHALYSAVVDVILAQFLTGWTGEDMDRAAENFVLNFG